MRNKLLPLRKSLIISIVFFALLAGCAPEEKPGQLKAINESFERSNKLMIDDIELVNDELLDLKKDIHTSSSTAEVWFLRAKQVQQYADSIRAMIKDVKDQIIVQSDSLKREYVTIVRHLYDANGRGGEIFKKLTAFKDSIPAIILEGEVTDKPFFRDLYRSLPLLPGYHDSLSADERKKYEKKWLEENFSRSSSLMAMVMLNKIENDVLTTEKLLFDHCNNSIGRGCVLAYYRFQAIGCLSSSYVKKGQTIDVNAGIGSFSAASKPAIYIDGKEITLTEDAVARYKFIANGSAGKHTIPVKFEYTNPDGSNATVTKELEYVIAEDK